jgi:hypothetical protein
VRDDKGAEGEVREGEVATEEFNGCKLVAK